MTKMLAVVAMSGDQEICNQIRAGFDNPQIEALKAENEFLRKLAINRPEFKKHPPEYWRELSAEAQLKYGHIGCKRRRIRQTVWAIAGLFPARGTGKRAGGIDHGADPKAIGKKDKNR